MTWGLDRNQSVALDRYITGNYGEDQFRYRYRRKRMRHWRIAANFHRVGDVVVTVQSPNWQGAIRKAALVIKHLPELKGKRLNMGSFMLQEIEAPPVSEQPSEQLPLQQAVPVAPVVEEPQTPPSTTSEPEK